MNTRTFLTGDVKSREQRVERCSTTNIEVDTSNVEYSITLKATKKNQYIVPRSVFSHKKLQSTGDNTTRFNDFPASTVIRSVRILDQQNQNIGPKHDFYNMDSRITLECELQEEQKDSVVFKHTEGSRADTRDASIQYSYAHNYKTGPLAGLNYIPLGLMGSITIEENFEKSSMVYSSGHVDSYKINNWKILYTTVELSETEHASNMKKFNAGNYHLNFIGTNSIQRELELSNENRYVGKPDNRHVKKMRMGVILDADINGASDKFGMLNNTMSSYEPLVPDFNNLVHGGSVQTDTENRAEHIISMLSQKSLGQLFEVDGNTLNEDYFQIECKLDPCDDDDEHNFKLESESNNLGFTLSYNTIPTSGKVYLFFDTKQTYDVKNSTRKTL